MLFSWKGLRAGKYDEGVLEALNRDEAVYLLKTDGVVITQLSQSDVLPKTKPIEDSSAKKKRRGSANLKQLVIFTKKLQTMLVAGLSIVETFEMLKDQTPSKMLPILEEMLEDINQGVPLSEAFGKHDHVFDVVFVNMVRAGESSGQLDEFLLKVIDYLERQIRIRKSIKAALTYPVVLLVVAIAVVACMLIMVVPVFEELFSGSGNQLPLATQIIVDISNGVRDPATMLPILSIIGGIILLHKILIKKYDGYAYSVDKFALRLPIVKGMILNSTLSKISMVQGNLYEAGVSMVETMDISMSTVKSRPIKSSLDDVKRGVYSGEPLSSLFKSFPEIYPPTFTALVEVGEKSGNLGDMFSSISQYFSENFDDSVKEFTDLLEPIMIIFMGVTIGFILIAMYLPMFNIGNAI